MAGEYITRPEHEEFVRRMDEANDRQSKRLAIVENDIRQIGELTTSVKELATSMKGMSKEQAKQGERLEALESRDGEMWRKVVGYVVTAIVGIAIGFVATQLGIG